MEINAARAASIVSVCPLIMTVLCVALHVTSLPCLIEPCYGGRFIVFAPVPFFSPPPPHFSGLILPPTGSSCFALCVIFS